MFLNCTFEDRACKVPKLTLPEPPPESETDVDDEEEKHGRKEPSLADRRRIR